MAIASIATQAIISSIGNDVVEANPNLTGPEAQHLYLTRARNAGSVDECMSIYERWAATYNSEVNDGAQEYVAPAIAAKLAHEISPCPSSSRYLDVGCGTGLVGQALHALGAGDIDGLDLSCAMLAEAKQTEVYRGLIQADLTKPIEMRDEIYDVVICVGTFTLGHVGPFPALRELIRVCKSKGFVVATILESLWEDGGFDTEVERLEADGVARVTQNRRIDYVKGHGDKAVLIVLQKPKAYL